ncbi:hypothetical protein ACFWGN_04195 [Oerskovia sp. NPDC060338]|uniref:hypothetical protein n=1 Tax=Oerskovia sp. NPDC060338 TaxID=3347100 RepID=UPI00365D4EF0
MTTTTCPTPRDLFGPDDPIPFELTALDEEHEGHEEFDGDDDLLPPSLRNLRLVAEIARGVINGVMDDLAELRRAETDEDVRLDYVSAENYAGQAWAQTSHLIRTLKEMNR